MAKFYVGQKVLVTESTRYDSIVYKSMIGNIYEVKKVGAGFDGSAIVLYNSDKTGYCIFNPSDLFPITETPETLTINGVEYVRKSEPAHEWKFGDVALVSCVA